MQNLNILKPAIRVGRYNTCTVLVGSYRSKINSIVAKINLECLSANTHVRIRWQKLYRAQHGRAERAEADASIFFHPYISNLLKYDFRCVAI